MQNLGRLPRVRQRSSNRVNNCLLFTHSDAHFSLAGGQVAFRPQRLRSHTLPAGEGAKIAAKLAKCGPRGDSALLLFTGKEQVGSGERRDGDRDLPM